MQFYKIEAEITNMSKKEIAEKIKDYDFKKLLQTLRLTRRYEHGMLLEENL